MPVRKPLLEELRRIADVYHLRLTDEDLAAFRNLMDEAIASYHRIDELAEPKLPVKYPRTAGYRPAPEENGTSLLEGYVPDVDATIVTRMLDAGAEVLGKAVCESPGDDATVLRAAYAFEVNR